MKMQQDGLQLTEGVVRVSQDKDDQPEVVEQTQRNGKQS